MHDPRWTTLARGLDGWACRRPGSEWRLLSEGRLRRGLFWVVGLAVRSRSGDKLWRSPRLLSVFRFRVMRRRYGGDREAEHLGHARSKQFPLSQPRRGGEGESLVQAKARAAASRNPLEELESRDGSDGRYDGYAALHPPLLFPAAAGMASSCATGLRRPQRIIGSGGAAGRSSLRMFGSTSGCRVGLPRLCGSGLSSWLDMLLDLRLRKGSGEIGYPSPVLPLLLRRSMLVVEASKIGKRGGNA